VVLWEGGEWLEEKVKLAELLHDTEGLMPPTFTISAEGEWSELLCGTLQDRTLLTESELEKKRWYVKDSSRNYGTGISICNGLKSCREKCTRGERFVVQLAVEPQLLIRETKFCVRIYLLVVSSKEEPFMHFYTYQDGWITLASKPCQVWGS